MEAAAHAGAEKLLWYATDNKVPAHFSPGYASLQANVCMHRGAGHPLADFVKAPSVEDAIRRGIMFAGTPDQVYRQIRQFYDAVGGFGHLLLMGQAGFLENEETKRGTSWFAREVYPR